MRTPPWPSLAVVVAMAGCSFVFTFPGADHRKDGGADAGGDTDAHADGNTDAGGDADADTDADADSDAGVDAGPACTYQPPPPQQTEYCQGLPETPETEEVGEPDVPSSAVDLGLTVTAPIRIRGVIDPGGDDDWWTITILADQTLTLYADDGSIGPDGDQLMAFVYENLSDAGAANLDGDSCGRNLGACALSCTEHLTSEGLAFTASEVGVYYLRVTHDDGDVSNLPYVICAVLQQGS